MLRSLVNFDRRRIVRLAAGRRRRSFSASSFAPWNVDSATGLVAHGKEEPMFQTIIGLEIHAQLQIPTKLFSSARVPAQHAPPNTHLALFDVAVPGALPVLSQAAVQAAVLSAAALNCQLAETSRFERKHYAYADLPNGYQITQQRWPLAVDGWIESSIITSKQVKKKKKKSKASSSETFRCSINRIQLEQDTGKTTSHTVDGTTFSRVDFNRAGSALIEIVTEPDLRSSQQAMAAVETVRQLLKHVGTCDGRLQEGSLRVDLNINLARLDDLSIKSPRVEVKNLNSLRQVQDAAEYEALRQAANWEASHGDGQSETRTWSVPKKATVLIRRKDDEQDYRFLPEPDLPPLVLNEKVLDGLSLMDFVDQHMPELPSQSFQRLIDSYGLSEYQAGVVTSDPPAIHILDTAVATAPRLLEEDNEASSSFSVQTVAQAATKLLSNELFALVKEGADDDHEASIQSSPVTGEQLGEVVALLLTETLSSTMAKTLLAVLYQEEEVGASPRSVAKARGLELVSDPIALQDLCRTVVDDHDDQLELYKQGGKYVNKIFKFLIGEAMKRSRGNAHPERLREALQDVLHDLAPI